MVYPKGVPEALVLLSEITLSAYPILIKSIPTNLWTQIVMRMGVYGSMAFLILLGQPKQLSTISPTYMISAGLLNLLHVGTSYKAFAELPAGNAMAIFYAYPIWNILGAWLLLGEAVPMDSLPWLALAFAGMIMIAQPSVGTLLDVKNPIALLSAVLSGMTESAIYFFIKILGKEDGTFKGLFELYGGSFFWILPVVLMSQFGGLDVYKIPKLDISWKTLIPILMFNVFIGFGGYTMRFFSIPLVSTMMFSILSFFGIVAAYIFGYLFQGEKPSTLAAIGSLAIIIANGVLLSK